MEIGTGQQLCVPIIEPFLLDHCLAFGTVSVPAGVVGVLGITALVARFNMSAECCGAAYFNTFHYLVLLSRQHVLIPVLRSIAVEYISHLQ